MRRFLFAKSVEPRDTRNKYVCCRHILHISRFRNKSHLQCILRRRKKRGPSVSTMHVRSNLTPTTLFALRGNSSQVFERVDASSVPIGPNGLNCVGSYSIQAT